MVVGSLVVLLLSVVTVDVLGVVDGVVVAG